MRRRFLQALTVGAATMALSRTISAKNKVFTVFTFGDSILDCGRYNEYGVHPGQLIIHNNDFLFPEFKGRDLSSQSSSMSPLLDHCARDGGVVANLSWQARGIRATGPAVALVTVGGNDLLTGLASDGGEGIAYFQQQLNAFLQALPVRPVLLGTVYDPTFGDDSRNFLATDARIARPNFHRINAVIRQLAPRYGELVDVHRHFLTGDPSWFTGIIEPSLRGASEVRAVFLPAVLRAFHAAQNG
jgi:acyl-CoA thioesterase-1